MSPQESENGNDGEEEENGTPDINEMAKRWRQGAPDEPQEEQPPGKSTYHDNGAFYVPHQIRDQFHDPTWDLPVRFPVQYDENANALIIQLDPVDGSDGDSQ